MASKGRQQEWMSASEFDALGAHVVEHVGERGGIEDLYPLSPVQEGMLFHTLASDSDDLYVVQQRLEIEGHLDVDRFRAAWALVIDRHPALRSVFSWAHEGRPVQVVCKGISLRIELHDLATDPDPEATITARFSADRRQRFELDRPPLMRIVVFRQSPDRHTMLWSQHHLLQDGWSASNVLGEVFATYEALEEGRTPDLPAVRPFSDYITWLHEKDPAETKAFWQEHLSGLAEPTNMVTRKPSADGPGFTRRFQALTPELTSSLQVLARRRGLTLNSVLVGALALVVGRYTGRSDAVIGFVAAGRPASLEGIESMVGMFINTLAVRLEIDASQPAVEWLADVQSRQAAVLEQEHSAMTDVQAWSGLGPGTTLTDTLFAYWNFGGEGTSPSGALRYRTVDGYGRTSFPFAITVESAEPINIGLDFDDGDFDTQRAEEFLVHYANLLGAIAADPDAPIGRLRMLTDSELNELALYNDTQRPTPHPSVVDAFRAQVAATPDAPALVFGDESVTYEELDRGSDRLAEQIIQRGGFMAQRVAVYLPRSLELVAAYLAVLKAGAAYVPLDRHLPRERIAYLLADSKADMVLTTSAMQSILPESGPTIVTLPLETGLSDTGPSDPGLSGSGPADAFEFDIPVGSGDLAYVMYTSGSTGSPKGVMVTHRGLINYVWWARRQYGGDRKVSFPLFTSTGFDLTVTSIYVPLVSGGHVEIYPDDDPRDLVVFDVFEQDCVDVVKLTPSHLALLEDRHLATNRIRTLILGGEDLRSSLARSIWERSEGRMTLFNEYGPTEATVGCMIHRYDPQSDTEGSVPIGRPIDNTRIYLLDDSLSAVPVGVHGEIYVAGDGLGRGYLDRPELTGERFVTDPSRPGERMYRTGDVASWRSPGLMEYLGRTDDQVKIRGYRIEPGEIEAILGAHPAVTRAAVAVREPRPGDLRLVAYYVAGEETPPNQTDLRQHLRDRLPDYMVTRHLVRVDSLPLTPNGKLDRSALPETIGDVATSIEFAPPQNDAEELVARLAGELLGVDRVSITDNFFELGGHSILAMQLISKLHEETGVRLSPRVILLNNLRHAAAQLPGVGERIESEGRSDTPSTERADEVTTTAYFFGDSAEPLFGVYSSPAVRTLRNRAVLLCPPIGWEYMRTHWTMRRIARLLAADGFHVLRFDYHGTGDSSGSRSEATFERWLSDVSVAAGELGEASGVDTISVVGVRLGATLAALAVERGLKVDRLVMWDPVVEGSEYLAALERMHRQMIAESNRRVTPAMVGDELLGFPYPPHRRRSLEPIDLTQLGWPAVPTVIVTSESRPEYDRLARAIGPGVRHDLVDDRTAWDELASSLGSLLPAKLPGHLVEALGGAS